MPPRFRFPEEAQDECVLAFTAHRQPVNVHRKYQRPEWRIRCLKFGTREEALKLLTPHIILCMKVHESDAQPILNVYKSAPIMCGYEAAQEVREALLPIVKFFTSGQKSL